MMAEDSSHLSSPDSAALKMHVNAAQIIIDSLKKRKLYWWIMEKNVCTQGVFIVCVCVCAHIY